MKGHALHHAEIDLKESVAVLKRQRKPIALIVALILGVALIYILAVTPIYRATTLVQVDAQGSNLLDPNGADQQQSAVLSSRLDSEVEILRSGSMALAVIQAGDLIRAPDFGPQLGWIETLGTALGVDLSMNGLRRRLGLVASTDEFESDLLNDTIVKVQEAVKIRRQDLTYLIAITSSSPNATRAADLANLYANTYIDAQVAAKTASMTNARDVLRRQIVTAQKQLSSSETAVNGFIESNLSRLEQESGDPAIAALRRQLESAKEDQGAASARITSVQTAIDVREWASVAQALESAAVEELDRQRRAVQQRLETAVAGAPEAIDLAAELERVDASLMTQSGASLDAARQQIAALGKRESAARDQLRAALLQSNLSAEMLTDLYNLQQSATLARSQYQTLLSREQDLGTLANLQIADARIVSVALPAASPATPNIKRIFALAIFGGVAFGVMFGFIREYYIGGISSASQLQNVMQARVPVSVPRVDLPDTGIPADLVVAAPMSPYAETFRKLRASIDLGLAKGDGVQSGAGVILVCSALQAEGKTTTAIALARTYALSGAHTLLIDADLRKPTLAQNLRCASPVGLLDYLVAWGTPDAPAPEAALDPLSPLVVLTAGERSAIPTDQLINSKALQELIENLRREFDVIIIDTPPLLPVVDTRYLVRHADAVVQVVRYGTTTQGEVRAAASQIHEMMRPGVRLYGTLNQEERGKQTYGYAGYYGDD